METPYRLIAAAERLKLGRRCNRITVRGFLSLFGAERRGATKVLEIRAILDDLGLQTEPDFETEWIDAPIWLKLKDGIPVTQLPGFDGDSAALDAVTEDILEGAPTVLEAVEPKPEQLDVSEAPEPPPNIEVSEGILSEDPTYRIGKLPAANIKNLITVSPNDPLMKAVTLMLQYDVSQLPIMQGDRDVKGMVTWKSIGLRHAFGNKCDNVNDCREEARISDSDRTLFDAIPTIVEHGYVLVRKLDRRISGIVTASDLSLQFQALSEPFLLLREIELDVRRLLGGKIATADFQILATPSPVARKLLGITDLTFGD